MIDRRTLTAALGGFTLATTGAFALHAASTPAPKGYVIGEIDVQDTQSYKDYAARTPAILAKYHGVYLVRGGATTPLEGAPPHSRVVVVEFPSVAEAKAFEESAEYRAAAEIRHKAATSRLFIAEGLAR
jgi:uncharacterized protein (DUF1330 family)